MHNLIIFITLIFIIHFTSTAPTDDQIVNLPGYPDDFNARIYAGYLKTSSSLRKLHYVFI